MPMVLSHPDNSIGCTRMIYECFYFYNELDLLDLKLHELKDVVDKFVLIEFRTSLTGKEQPLYYEENKERFSDFHDQIIHVIGPDHMPHTDSNHLYLCRKENYMQGLVDAKPNDIIISSDPDIVFKKDAIIELEKHSMENTEMQLISDWYCYYMDFLYTKARFGFNGATYYKNIVAGGWEKVFRWRPMETLAVSAGYHFSKLGGVDALFDNISGYPHQELNNDRIKNREKMLIKMDRGVAWDDPNENANPVMVHVPYDPANYPEYLNAHPEIYSKYFKVWP